MANAMDLAKNEEFIEKLVNTETPEEAIALFEENGVTVTKEELAAAVEAANEAPDGELSDTALDSVAGGFVATAVVSGVILYAGKKGLEITHGDKWWGRQFKKWFK